MSIHRQGSSRWPRIVIILVISLFATGTFLYFSEGLAANGTAGIAGTVTDEDNTPLPGIHVILYRYDDGSWSKLEEALDVTDTNASGYYQFDGLSAGTYGLEFLDPTETYVGEYYDDVSETYLAAPIVVSDVITTGIDASLALVPAPPTGHIEGDVIIPGGAPATHLRVKVYRKEGETWSYQRTVEPSDPFLPGHYAVTELITGYYTLEFVDGDGVFASEYYNDAWHIDNATALSVTEGTTLLNIDAAFEERGCIMGTVTEAGSGDPISVINVRAHPKQHGISKDAQTGYDGQYRLCLDTGTYTVQFYDNLQEPGAAYATEYYDDVWDEAAATVITVTGGLTTTHVDAALSLMGSITGTVVDPWGRPIPRFTIEVEGVSDPSWTSSHHVYASPYQIHLPAGSYHLRFDSDGYTSEHYNDVLDPGAATPVPVSGGANTTDVNVVLGDHGNGLSGHVTDASGRPLADAWATLYLTGPTYLRSTRTDVLGRYRFDDLVTNTYYVKFERRHYVSEYYDDAPDFSSAQGISFTVGSDVENIDAALTRYGSIVGFVRAPDGSPAANFGADAYRWDQGHWLREAQAYPAPDRAGDYHLKSLPAGDYLVRFWDKSQTYATQIYENVHDLGSATLLSVTPGITLTSVDATFVPRGCITGLVTTEAGAPITDVLVSASPISEFPFYGQWGSANTDAKGAYRLCLDTGTYHVEFTPTGPNYVGEYYADATDVLSATAITMTPGITLSHIDANLELSVHLTGTVRFPDGSPADYFYVQILDANNGELVDAWSVNPYVGPPSTDGRFAFHNLTAGVYKILFGDNKGYRYGSEYYDNVHEFADASPITLHAGEIITGIIATLGDLGGLITGEVQAPDGQPLEGIQVDLFQRHGGRWSGVWRKRLSTDPLGRYSIDGLSPGVYIVKFHDPSERYVDEYYDNAGSEIGATPLNLYTTDQTLTGVDAVLTPRQFGCIRGTVLASSSPLSDTEVRSLSALDGTWGETFTTDANGTYRMCLEAGSYRLYFNHPSNLYYPEYHNNVRHRAYATSIGVSPNLSVTVDANMDLKPAGSITGTVVDAGGAPIPRFRMRVYDAETNRVVRSRGWFFYEPPALKDGKFDFHGLLEGFYKLLVDDYWGPYTPEYYEDTTNLRHASLVQVTADTVTSNIRVVLGDYGGMVAGSVTAASGDPIGDIQVTVYDASGNVEHATTTLEDGTYKVGGFDTGTYYVGFEDPISRYVPEYYNDAPDLVSARPISITFDVTTTGVDAVLEAVPPPPTPVQDVLLEGPSTGVPGTGCTFTATITPITATLPITFAWHATDQTPVVTSTDQLTDTVTFTWPTPGTKGITVTATNPAGSVTRTHVLTLTSVPPPLTALDFTKAVSALAVQPGDTLTYRLILTATGGVTPTTLIDTLAFGTSYVPGSVTGGATYAEGAIRYAGPVTPGQPLNITYQVTVDTKLAPGSVLYSDARAESAGHWLEQGLAVAVPDPAVTGTLVLIYAGGDNDLAADMVRLLNRAEVGAGSPHASVVLLLDGPGAEDAYLYHLKEDHDLGCPNILNPRCGLRYVMGQSLWTWSDHVATPYSLAEFIKGGIKAHPNAEQIVLVLAGHGGGWSPDLLAGQPSGHGGQPGDDPLGGLLWDDHPGRALSTPALGDALRWASQASARDIDLLYLDACLMAMAEVAYEVHDSVDYLLASESWSWATFPYDAHLTALDGAQSAQQVGEAWLSNEAAAYRAEAYPFTLSLVDLSKMEMLQTTVNAWTEALSATLPITDPIAASATLTACFDSDQDGVITPADNYCDLRLLARQTQHTFAGNTAVVNAAQAVETAVATAVVAEDHAGGTPWPFPNALWAWDALGGISIYAPWHSDHWTRRYYSEAHLSWARDGLSDSFLDAYWAHAAPPDDPDCPPEGCPIPPGPLPSDHPGLHAVTPVQGRNDVPVVLTIWGENLAPDITATLVNITHTLPLERLRWLTQDQIRAEVPAGSAPGRYDLVVSRPQAGQATLHSAYRVIDAVGPLDDLYAGPLDLWVFTPTLRSGQNTELGLRVHHQGGKQPVSTTVRFYVNAVADDTRIGEAATPLIGVDDSASTGALTWTPETTGTHTLYAVIDPEERVAEIPAFAEANNLVTRTIEVAGPQDDTAPPYMDWLLINEGADRTSIAQVTLDASASEMSLPNQSGVSAILYEELEYNEGARDWVLVQQSGWLDYATSHTAYPWTLIDSRGVRYLRAWAADGAGNLSPSPAMDFINYLPPTEHIQAGATHLYRHRLAQGQRLTVCVSPITGDPDLYVWPPTWSYGAWSSAQGGTTEEIVTLTAPEAGTYQIEVYGYTDAEYAIDISVSATTHGAGGYTLGITAPPTKTLRSAPIVDPRNVPSSRYAIPTPPPPSSEPRQTSWYLYLPLVLKDDG
jgi:uncharacterized repeat protein (TIGR01451 family)